MLIGIAAAYSYLGEGHTDPLAGENFATSSDGKGVVDRGPYRKGSNAGKYGTGLGLQQWSFERHDNLLINLNKWSTIPAGDDLGTIVPSLQAQLMFACKELISLQEGKFLISVANKPSTSIDEVLAIFLMIQNGWDYGGRCVDRLLDSRLEMNTFGVLPDELKAVRSKVLAAAIKYKPTGHCPKV